MHTYKKSASEHQKEVEIVANLLGCRLLYPNIYVHSKELGGEFSIEFSTDKVCEIFAQSFTFDGNQSLRMSIAGGVPTMFSPAGRKRVRDYTRINGNSMRRFSKQDSPAMVARMIRDEFVPAMEKLHGEDLRDRLKQATERTDRLAAASSALQCMGFDPPERTVATFPGKRLSATIGGFGADVTFSFTVSAENIADVFPVIADVIGVAGEKP
jgi:hypothetical protein